ncbi:MAG: UDP-N-acetylmuramoyl-tripeptide--D-alanyl-D-alanine ligase, partial [Kiritimatiellae bacterium]|nr:UDP-N-acetylmuramoyl-tripeptide--D-alanyl-D-alanine ligase [Kiritimatiellia bacterium]
DPAQALSDLAEGYRKSLKATVVGITGSAGKTTLKELTAAMLSGAGQTAATPGNYNNEVGLPLSLLSVPEEARFAVIEAGISHPNDMDPLAKTMCPDVAAISCIGPAHIEYFGSERAIAAEKAKLLAKVPPTGFAVIPDTCAEFETLRTACQCRVITCSIKNDTADWYGEPLAKGVVRVHHGDESAVLLETGLAGEHTASNALVAYALARECGISAAEALAGLRHFKAPAMRWETTRAGGFTVINDAYNANPLSMRAALETFAGSDVTGTKVVCIGDMLELGDASDRQHRDVGEASGNGPWRLLAGVGTASRALIEGAIKAGYPASQTVWFATTNEAVEALPLLLQPGDTLLLKASRGMRLEQILDALRA